MAAAVAAAVVMPVSVTAAVPRSGCGRILFTSYSNGRSGIQTITARGSGRSTLVSFRKLAVTQAEWSPDARRIAFVRDGRTSDGSGISVMRADGSGRRRLTGRRARHHSITWAPDGKRLAFVRSPLEGEEHKIMILRLRDGHRRFLAGGTDPVWSPDGSTVAFSRRVADTNDLATIPAGGGAITTVTTSPLDDDEEAVWSPDGRWLAFARYPRAQDGDDGPFADIWKAAADGSGEVRLTHDQNDLSGYNLPRWSPDGSRIAYSYGHDSGGSVFVMNADGSDQTRVSGRAAVDQGPEWAPSSTRLVYWSAGDLVIVRLSDGRRRRLTDSVWAHAYSERWSPCTAAA